MRETKIREIYDANDKTGFKWHLITDIEYKSTGPTFKFSFYYGLKNTQSVFAEVPMLPEVALRVADIIKEEVQRAHKVYDRIGGLL